MDGRLLPRTARLGAADDSPVVERAGRAEAAHGISAHRDGAGPHDSAAHESACLARRPPGHGARARGPCRRQRRSDAGAAQRGRSRSRGGRGGPGPSRPQSRPRPARSQSGANGSFGEPVVGHRQRLRSHPARRRDRVREDGSLFRGDRGVPSTGKAGACPPARDRADRTVPEAFPDPLRLRTGRLALRPALVAASASMARDCQRRGEGDRGRALGLVPALCEPRPDRRRRGT